MASRNRYGRDWWREAFKRFAKSGLGVDKFCADEGVCRSSFYRWREALKGLHAQGAPEFGVCPTARQSPAAFVDLGALAVSTTCTEPVASESACAPSLQPPARLNLRIELGPGLVLHLERG